MHCQWSKLSENENLKKRNLNLSPKRLEIEQSGQKIGITTTDHVDSDQNIFKKSKKLIFSENYPKTEICTKAVTIW